MEQKPFEQNTGHSIPENIKMKKEFALSQQQIENRIFTIRGVQVMIDRDLAEIYQVETRVLTNGCGLYIQT